MVKFQANQVNNSSNPSTPPITNEALSAVNAMRASMDSIRSMDAMRSSVMDMSSPQPSQQPDALRMQQHAEALLRQQAEAALRLAMSQVNAQEVDGPSNGSRRDPDVQVAASLVECCGFVVCYVSVRCLLGFGGAG